jgi:dephospho-CoA kinase
MIIGITGGIGGGKSTVSDMLKVRGYRIYNTDREARRLQNTDPEIRRAIEEVFSKEAYVDDTLNTPYISSIVFAHPDKLKVINEIVHPAVIKDIEHVADGLQPHEILFVESALLYESGLNRLTDKIIVVTAPEDLRISRVMSRDGANREQVQARIANQFPEYVKVSSADYVIDTSDSAGVLQQLEIILNDIVATLSL